jgi:N-acetylneuraminate lyase
MDDRLTGLVAATYTPMKPDGGLSLSRIAPIVDHLVACGARGLYVCGSTGEGMSLTGEERRAVAEAYARAAHGRLRVIVQVGHNSLAEARQLADHARKIGVDAISATAPSYFKITSVDGLVACMAEIAAGAPDLPFYYYHIPVLTGASLDMIEFLEQAPKRIANLAGVKYTAPTVHEFQTCLEFAGGRFDMLWGSDEMLLSALVVGARGAVGSTYNVAAPLYRRIFDAFDAGRLDEARRLQFLSVQMIRTLYRYPFHPAMKAVLKMLGLDCGPCRLPLPPLQSQDAESLRRELDAIGFFQWSKPGGAPRG